MSSIVLKTTPQDKKNYPSYNQFSFCWQKYNEFVLCVKKEKGDESACAHARQLAHSICLDDWMEKWDGERKEGKFLGVQEVEREKSHGHH